VLHAKYLSSRNFAARLSVIPEFRAKRNIRDPGLLLVCAEFVTLDTGARPSGPAAVTESAQLQTTAISTATDGVSRNVQLTGEWASPQAASSRNCASPTPFAPILTDMRMLPSAV
jgi:hypothetical protein